MRNVLIVLVVLTLGLLTSGCTLIGLGIGAAVPKYESVDPSQLEKGDDVVVTSNDLSKTSGEFVAASHGNITIEPDEFHLTALGKVPHTITANDVRKRGSYWAMGLGLGLALDVIVAAGLVALYVAASNWSGVTYF